MVNWRSLFKPEYLCRPTQFVRRLAFGVVPPRRGRVTASVPWGWDIEVRSDEDLGRSILLLGVYDLVVSEAIWRLTDAGESALDIGANIGYMTALLARRVGRSGKVLSFEAHPDIARELRGNLDRWEASTGRGVVQVFEQALSDREGTVRLEVPAGFTTNRGIARVADSSGTVEAGGALLSIPCGTLDRALVGLGPVGVAKMDVEGHEEAVLRGARGALEDRQVRDWVFEHHPSYPSPVTELFERNGYQVFQLEKRFLGPGLVPAATPATRSLWEPPNYLATLNPERALDRMRAKGWRVLRRPTPRDI
jgi:FkbM family methyltransferase